jgi:hypothetical protein
MYKKTTIAIEIKKVNADRTGILEAEIKKLTEINAPAIKPFCMADLLAFCFIRNYIFNLCKSRKK